MVIYLMCFKVFANIQLIQGHLHGVKAGWSCTLKSGSFLSVGDNFSPFRLGPKHRPYVVGVGVAVPLHQRCRDTSACFTMVFDAEGSRVRNGIVNGEL
jgi:hypothetical protein